MSKGKIDEVIAQMDLHEAALELADAARRVFHVLGEEALRVFLARLMGDDGTDKTIGLVHL
jgi:hypothetical protein